MQITQISHIKQRLLAKAAAVGLPLSGAFELTPRCNFSCKMCYVHMTPEQMRPLGRERSAEEWIRLAEEAHSAGMTFLLLTGGEPLLRQDFPRIYRAMAKMGLSISINSNGALLTDSIRELFTEYPPANINITLYATSAEGYGALCGNKDAYERVLDSLKWLRQRNILVNLNATITPWNRDQLMGIEEFARQGGYNLRLTTYCFPPVRRCGEDTPSRLTPEEAGKLRALDFAAQQGMEAVRKFATQLDVPPQDVEVRSLECGDPMHCYAGRSQFWVSWHGGMTACGMLNAPVAQPFEEGFLPAWEQIRQETAKIRLCPDCVECPERSTCISCAAVISAETGRFDGKPEYMCKLNRAFREGIQSLAKESCE